ncbi:MAG: AAA family ATPase [Prevotellaceae bacterium]|jgi:predicted ATP-dependent endonuclease of OLD family|nr:AAA family ATPase [Prevotellaceae bacterium]
MNINGISFENFRVFKDKSDFELAPITILTGANSSGKTTIIKGLKLFQSFWKQDGFGDLLNFENGNHQLGNFEMTLSKHSEKKELIVQYKINHFLLDSLYVELIFEQDNGNPLKNGILKESSIISKDELTIFQVHLRDQKSKEDRDIYSGYNTKYIIEVLIPKLKELRSEYKSFQKKMSENSENHEDFAVIDIRQECLKNDIDPDRYCELMDLLEFENANNYFKPNISNFLDSDNDSVFTVEIFKLFSQISYSEDTLFAKELYELLCEKYPETPERFDYAAFKEFIDKENIGSWANKFLLDSEQSLESLLKEQNTFPFFYGTVHRLDGFATHKFYNPLVCEKANNDEKIWWDDIFSDAKKIAQEIRNDKSEFTVDTVVTTVKRLLENITYKSIKSTFASMYFINAIRANSQRFYSFDLRDADFNLFITDFLKRSYTEKEKAFLKKWIQEFEIADDYSIELIDGAGTQVFLIKDEEKINLVDLGYGVTQLLPVLLKIAYCNNIGKHIIVIEEPETNLHPKFQSKIADLLVDARKTLNMRFIIETHSEYLIRKLQYLTAKGELKTEDTILYYIGNPDVRKREDGEEQIIEIRILKEGQLSQPFGSGFTDESLRWLKAMFTCNLN